MSTYEQYLRGEQQKERNRQSVQSTNEMNKRVRDFIADIEKSAKKEAEIQEKKFQNDLEAINKKMVETVNNIKSAGINEKKKMDALEAEMRKKADEEIAARTKEYNEIIEKQKNELKIERLEIEKDLIDGDSELIKIHQSYQDTQLLELEKLQERRDRLVEEARKRDAARSAEQTSALVTNLEEKKNIEAEVAKKAEELCDKKTKHLEIINNLEVDDRKKTFETLVIRQSQVNSRSMNNLIEKARDNNERTQEAYFSCQAYLVNDKNCQIQRQQLISMQRSLCEIDDDDQRIKTDKRIRVAQKKLFAIGNCIASFLGRLMIGQTPRHEEDQQKLDSLMVQVSAIITDIENFNPKHAQLRDHLQPKTEQKKEQIEGPSSS
ncbi:unnamed protein product [Caenorhabditis sp. 36 PRJEB53466]|nr:unnamed protein product [Caenorhabditis sp. 36 PRJEB53466]